jgi:hypothetical protein
MARARNGDEKALVDWFRLHERDESARTGHVD